jgi:hypothetical protein
MKTSVRVFVLLTVAAAVASAAAVGALGIENPSPFDSSIGRSIGGLGVLGAISWAISHGLGKAALGSVAFMPWLAAVLISPSQYTLLCIAGSAVAGEIFRRNQPIKAIFNAAQLTTSSAAAALAYVVLGGAPLAVDERLRLVPYVVASCAFFAANTLAVAVVVALHEGSGVLSVWRRNTKGNLLNDLLALPLVFGFAIVVNRLGLTGIVVIGTLLVALRQLYKVNAQLQTTNAELLEVLVHAIELRDPYTSGHSQRVARYSRVIARALGLGVKQTERLSVAALLHDVGKIDQMFVPILSKPGRLTSEERAIMELHPIKSAELVAKVSELADPDGLRGEETPLLARIIVFADTIDAMLTDRPYRKALGRHEVEAELRRCRGTQFDPTICDTLLASPHFGQLFVGGELESNSGKVAAIPRRTSGVIPQVA